MLRNNRSVRVHTSDANLDWKQRDYMIISYYIKIHKPKWHTPTTTLSNFSFAHVSWKYFHSDKCSYRLHLYAHPPTLQEQLFGMVGNSISFRCLFRRPWQRFHSAAIQTLYRSTFCARSQPLMGWVGGTKTEILGLVTCSQNGTHPPPYQTFHSHMSVESTFIQTSAHIVFIHMPTLQPFRSNFLGWLETPSASGVCSDGHGRGSTLQPSKLFTDPPFAPDPNLPWLCRALWRCWHT